MEKWGYIPLNATINKSSKKSVGQYYRLFTAPKAEIQIIESRCKGCGFCVEFCPVEVLEVSKEINQKGYHPPKVKDIQKCVVCKTCEYLCPDLAIFVTKKEES